MPRTIITNRTIRKCYAKLAMTHFKEAEKEATLSPGAAIDATQKRMMLVEDFINKAGGEAVGQVFGNWW